MKEVEIISFCWDGMYAGLGLVAVLEDRADTIGRFYNIYKIPLNEDVMSKGCYTKMSSCNLCTLWRCLNHLGMQNCTIKIVKFLCIVSFPYI